MLRALHDLAERGDEVDVVVIGGGVTGAGVALDAAARGLSTVLVERDDFASGTSSKSSKLVHGGLRYLQNGEVRLVYEALRERRRIMRNAPHLVGVMPFLIPILTRDGVVSRKIARALGSAMWMYDVTGGWRIGRLHRRVDADEAFRHFPTARRDRLSAGYLYYDAAADDARLTLTIARTAAAHGAIVLNRCNVVEVTSTPDAEHGGRADGVVVDASTPSGVERISIRTRVVVNAAGVWADEVRALDEGDDPHSIRPAKGVHVTIPWDLVRNDVAVVIPVRGDRRSLFLVPWDPLPDGSFRHTYVGTTDTDFDGPLEDPHCDGDDVDYVLGALDDSLTTTVTRDDITGVWAGLRPLVRADADDPHSSGRTADLSRDHQVEVSERGVVRVLGGKLTTYRLMAEDTVDRVVELLGRRRGLLRRHPTRSLRLLGATAERGTPGTLDAHLLGRYGTLAAEIKALVALDPTLGEPLVPGQPYLRAEAVHAARREMATTLDDVLTRRTRAHLFDRDASLEAAPEVARLLAGELGWDEAETAQQVAAYRERCQAEREAVGIHRRPARADEITVPTT